MPGMDISLADIPDFPSGSCQFPTLGFVVDRYFRVKRFLPEQFWSIQVVERREDINATFSWRRHRLFDRMAVVILFERCLTARTARVSKVQKKPTSKWRPLPLTTVELQKLGSMFLRMDSQRVMKVGISSIRVRIVTKPHPGCRRPLHQGMDQLPANRDRFI